MSTTSEAGIAGGNNVSSSFRLAAADSGRLSYTSLGDRSLGLLSECSGRASSFGGSGRRLSVQLGRCKFVKQDGSGSSSFFLKSKGDKSSGGAFEYVVDESSRIEIFIPDHDPEEQQAIDGVASPVVDVALGGGAELSSVHDRLWTGVDQAGIASKRAVSFRLPLAAAPAKLKASASRRSLSDSEAFAFWEASCDKNGGDDGDERRLVVVDGQRSSSFARKTVEWLVRWQRRMVHPDGGGIIGSNSMGCGVP